MYQRMKIPKNNENLVCFTEDPETLRQLYASAAVDGIVIVVVIVVVVIVKLLLLLLLSLLLLL